MLVSTAMDSSLFISLIEKEYQSAISKTSHDLRGDRPQKVLCTQQAGDEEITKFKRWFGNAINTTEVHSGGTTINARDAVVHAALKTTAVPPHRPYHPKLISALSLFSNQELEEILGIGKAREVERVVPFRK